MNFAIVAGLNKRKKSDLLVLPFCKGKKHAEWLTDVGDLKSYVEAPIKSKDFSGKEGEVLIVYPSDGNESRIALLGLGEKEKLNIERLRRAYASLTRACHQRKLKDIHIFMPKLDSLMEGVVARGIAEGMLSANYCFEKLKHHSIKENPAVLVSKVTIIGGSTVTLDQFQKSEAIFQGVYLARDLVNGNADHVTPQHLAKVAQDLAEKLPHLKVTVFDKKRIEKEKMGLLLAVNRGSSTDPVFIIMEYKGNPKEKESTVIVGKGITYDTGGLNLKPTGSMETMKCDMSGAATAIGTMMAAAMLNLKVNITAVIPSTENSIGSRSYKPGDVYVSYLGQTVEIGNTDAEGRLILADALAYTVKNLNPACVIDFATLTGAIDVALGSEASGLMSNNDPLADALSQAGSETFERVWRMPLYEEYREQLKSDIADIKNIGGRSAGAITAAVFLQEFVGQVPWAHFDIASTAYLSEAKRYHPKRATGVGIRLMIEFLEHKCIA